MAAQRAGGRPVKFAVTRQQMFASSATAHHHPAHPARRARDGRLTAISHDVVEQTATVKEYAEQTADPDADDVRRRQPKNLAPARRARCAGAVLDARPGECPGMFALEVAMDELAVACGIDPIELRIRNEPDVDPETGNPWSDRRLVECLRNGAERFGWAHRDPTPGSRRDGEWLVGTGRRRPRCIRRCSCPATRPHRCLAPRPLRGADRRRRHRHRRLDGADADRRRRARLSPDSAHRPADRGHRAAVAHRWPAVRRAPVPGASAIARRPQAVPARSTATSRPSAPPPPPTPPRRRRPRSTPCTRSVRISPEARVSSVHRRDPRSPGCSASSPSAGRSTRRRCAHNSSAA